MSPEEEAAVKTLMEMGFDQRAATAASSLARGNVGVALNYIDAVHSIA